MVSDDELRRLDDLWRAAQSDEWNVRMPALDAMLGMLRRDDYAALGGLIADLRAERERWMRLRGWLMGHRNDAWRPLNEVWKKMNELEAIGQPPASTPAAAAPPPPEHA